MSSHLAHCRKPPHLSLLGVESLDVSLALLESSSKGELSLDAVNTMGRVDVLDKTDLIACGATLT